MPAGDAKVGQFDWNVALNASPILLDKLNDLPVKKVNGTIIYIHDVAYVHQGSPPQTNLVRVNGSRAVLMTILKAGAASTLEVIDGIKSLLPRVEESLPSSLNLHAVGDQSIFVKTAVFGVIREAALAAALVGVMILIFLGSWRSTVIILIEIPLAILFALTALSWLGETINVMTLGGLALAVGILVDDGTVTIENINYHLEQGKGIKAAILDGAQQIVIPAFVTLLCLCIVFLPMFRLGGVAGYLFRPLAEAVVFALIGSFLLSRTLVPTMANYLMRRSNRAVITIHRCPRRALARSSDFSRSFERRFSRVRAGATAGFFCSRLGVPRPSLPAMLDLRDPVLWPLAVPWRELLSRGRFRPDPDACPRADRHAHRGDRAAIRPHRADSASDHPTPDQIDNIVDNIGLPFSGINTAYQNTGTIGPEDGDALISLNENHAPTANYVKQLRTVLPQQFPGTTFSFLPADIVSQILNFGLPAPSTCRSSATTKPANYAYATDLLKRIRNVPGIADPAHSSRCSIFRRSTSTSIGHWQPKSD